MKTKIKKIIKKIFAKINIFYRYDNYILDLNKKIFKKNIELESRLLEIENKINNLSNNSNQLLEIENKINNLSNNSNQLLEIENKINNLSNNSNQLLEIENKIEYLENLIKVSTDITKIPKATGNLRKIQEANSILLKIIDKICKKYRLKYWISFGTLLGAIRHSGFIPWDDDLDISMMRSDYEKLFKILKNEFKNTEFYLIRSEIIRIYYSNTPLQLDIFPWDLYYKKINNLKEKEIIINKISQQQKKINYNWENLNNLKNIITNLSYNEICALKDKYILKGKTSNINIKPAIFRGLETPSGKTQKSEIYNYNDIFPLKKIKFEKLNLYCPNKYKKILTEEYINPFDFPTNFYSKHESITKKINPSTIEKIENFILKHEKDHVN